MCAACTNFQNLLDPIVSSQLAVAHENPQRDTGLVNTHQLLTTQLIPIPILLIPTPMLAGMRYNRVFTCSRAAGVKGVGYGASPLAAQRARAPPNAGGPAPQMPGENPLIRRQTTHAGRKATGLPRDTKIKC